MATHRPNTPHARYTKHLAEADFPVPGSPAISMFGLVISPAAYAANGSKQNVAPPARTFVPR